jgi:predicted esterase
MQRSRLALAVAVGLGCLLGCPSGTAAATPSPCGQLAVSILAVPDEGATRTVEVVRLPGPDTASTPVLYFLHGYPGTPASVAPTAEGLVRAACATGHRLVVALPDGSVGARDSEWGDSVDGSQDLEAFVTTVAIQAVEGAAPRPARLRIIGGFSMGGFGAAAIGMRHPALFGRVLAVAGYFHLDDPDHVFGTTEAQRSPHSPDHLVRAGSPQRFFLVDGAQDPLALVHDESPRLARLLRSKHVAVQLYRPSGGHSLRVLDPVLVPLLDFLV